MSTSSSYSGSPVTSPSAVLASYVTDTPVQMAPETESTVQMNLETPLPAVVEPADSESHGTECEVPNEDSDDDDDESVIFILESEDSHSALEGMATFAEPTLRSCEWLEGGVDGDTVEGWGFLPWFVDDDGASAYPHPLSYHDPFHRYHNGYYGPVSVEDQSQYKRMGNIPRWTDLMLPSCLASNGPTLPSIHDLLVTPEPTSNEIAPLRLPSDPLVFQRVCDARDQFHASQQREAFSPAVGSSSPVASSATGALSYSTGASYYSTGASCYSTGVSSSLIAASSASAGAEPDWLTAAKDLVTASFERQQQSSSKRRLEVEPGREFGAQRGLGSESSRWDCLRSQDLEDGVVRGLEMEFQIPHRLLKHLRRS